MWDLFFINYQYLYKNHTVPIIIYIMHERGEIKRT